ncbi:Adaptin N terminal region [Babesia microti strain RI]|uniref:Coatomer subunit gamma n=1 Tax=Babesia microti (strain RI) TaxID=1133968 RepID=I7JDI8_BABMR|nr:Adaptin N terminal region [Babesia microti strain RI]CCF75830.1 Adaptin N terminal region [Babesia microti strain RI]|eukprot:XP_012650238.1 Adaptin N terminal region [Babesia microti strain RI]
MSSALRETISNAVSSFQERHGNNQNSNPHLNDKASVLVGTKVFRKLPLNVKLCKQSLVKILFLLNNGRDEFTEAEATDVFFGVTRLFESNDHSLRKLMYLVIKSIRVSEAESLVVTSSLTKDINSNNTCYKANAIRTLGCIVDGSTAAQIDRHLKASILDKDPFVKSCAIICGIHIFESNSEMVKRWTNEVMECVKSNNPMVQYHALTLMLKIRGGDKLLLIKLANTLNSYVSPYVECVLIKFYVDVLTSDIGETNERQVICFLKNCLLSDSLITKLEACKAFVTIATDHYEKFKNFDLFPYHDELSSVILILKSFITSNDRFVIFSGIKQLFSLSQIMSNFVEPLNNQLEMLLKHDNRAISSLAVGTLLKTGSESTIDNLLTRVVGVLQDSSDDFKLEVVKAVEHLCIVYPSKCKLVISFLSKVFQSGGYEFKNATVNSIINIINSVPSCMLYGLDHLCEFIEDCDYSHINIQILQFLSNVIPKTPDPSSYIRYIYNRLILEKSDVRAAVVSCLAFISLSCPHLNKDLCVILACCLDDVDEEVRERAKVYYKAIRDSDTVELGKLLDLELSYDVAALSSHLEDRVRNGLCGDKFDISVAIKPPTRTSTKESNDSQVIQQQIDYNEIIRSILPELKDLQLLVKTNPTNLTEDEADYVVSVVKYIFESHILFEFLVENTLEFELKDINISLTPISTEPLNIVGVLPIDHLSYGQQESLFVLVKYNNNLTIGCSSEKYLLGSYGITLSFNIIESQDYDPYDDTYTTNSMSLRGGDYFTSWQMDKDTFMVEWEGKDLHEDISNYGLSFKSIDKAVPGFIKFMNLTVCHQSSDNFQNLLLAGKCLGTCKTLVNATIGMSSSGCILRMTVRSQNKNVNKLLLSCIE